MKSGELSQAALSQRHRVLRGHGAAVMSQEHTVNNNVEKVEQGQMGECGLETNREAASLGCRVHLQEVVSIG